MPIILAIIGVFLMGVLAGQTEGEVRVTFDEPVTCVVELNQNAGLNQQRIVYEGRVKR